jgi:hypothetical protein
MEVLQRLLAVRHSADLRRAFTGSQDLASEIGVSRIVID